MEKRDVLKDQIEQLARALAKILSDFIGRKESGQGTQGIKIGNEQLQSELEIEIAQLLALSKAELKDYLEKRNLKANHLELLSEYMKEIGIEEMKTDKAKAKLYLLKAIELIEIADESTKTMTFDRMNLKIEIEKILS